MIFLRVSDSAVFTRVEELADIALLKVLENNDLRLEDNLLPSGGERLLGEGECI